MAKNKKFDVMLVEDRAVAHVQAMAIRLMAERGMKKQELAKAMGVSPARVSQMFAAEPSNLTIKTAAHLFHLLGDELKFTTGKIDVMNAEAEKSRARKLAALDSAAQSFRWSFDFEAVNSNEPDRDRECAAARAPVAA